jgi:putative phosphoribosyl transferase
MSVSSSVQSAAGMRFRDRAHAGRVLARALLAYAGRDDVVVLALPRGGVPVAAELARALGVHLDVFVVRKLGLPGHEELAMGAVAPGGVLVLDHRLVRGLGIPDEVLQETVEKELRELERREAAYRAGRPPLDLEGRTVILVDDGLATGATMRAAALALRKYKPARVVVAVPVASAETCDEFRADVDEIVCALTPSPFHAVGLWHDDFPQTGDEEVRELLRDSSDDEETAG